MRGVRGVGVRGVRGVLSGGEWDVSGVTVARVARITGPFRRGVGSHTISPTRSVMAGCVHRGHRQ